MFPSDPPEDNRNYTSGFLGFSEGVGWKRLLEMGQSLTLFMECGGFLLDIFKQCKQICRFPANLRGFS